MFYAIRIGTGNGDLFLTLRALCLNHVAIPGRRYAVWTFDR